MPTFRFNKLVRSKLLATYNAHNQKVSIKHLQRNELFLALRSKLIEEANELPSDFANRKDVIEELADIEQVCEDIRAHLQISSDEITAVKNKKLQDKGGFINGVYVEAITLSSSDKWVQYYRNNPRKYPEIDAGAVGCSSQRDSIKSGVYRHVKSDKLYEVVALATHTETNEQLVLYRPLYKSDDEYFVRPLAMFTELVEINNSSTPRFVKVDN